MSRSARSVPASWLARDSRKPRRTAVLPACYHRCITTSRDSARLVSRPLSRPSPARLREAAQVIRRVQRRAVTACGGVGKKGQDVAGGVLLAAGFRQRQVCPGLVAVAAPVLLFDSVAGFGRAGDGAVGAAFGDARLAAMSRTRTCGSWAMHGSARALLAGKVRFATIK